MQSATMLRSANILSSTRHMQSSNRVQGQRTLAPFALQQRRTTIIRAEANNTGESITNSGKTKNPDSYERIEAPVRGESSSDQTYGYGGKPVSERQSDVDRLLVDQDAPEEQRILGTTVSFPDAFRFKGAAPEVINSRLAMLGLIAALTAEAATGKNVFQQAQAYPGFIAATFALWTVASLVPILRGVPRKGNFIFTSGRELINGRVAMLGFVALLATEYFSGGQTIPQFYGLFK